VIILKLISNEEYMERKSQILKHIMDWFFISPQYSVGKWKDPALKKEE